MQNSANVFRLCIQRDHDSAKLNVLLSSALFGEHDK